MVEFFEHVVPLTHCPCCGHKFDRASGFISKDKPEAGNFTACIECAQVLRYLADGQMCKATDEDLVELALDNPKAFYVLTSLQNAIAGIKGKS